MKTPPSPPFAMVGFHPDDRQANRGERRWKLLTRPNEVLSGQSLEASQGLARLEEGGAWFGFLGFELGEWTEQIEPRESCDWGLPDFWFADFQSIEPAFLDAEKKEVSSRREPIQATLSNTEHTRCLARIQEYLEAGDIYQANLTVRFEATGLQDPWETFLRIAQRSQAPYMAYLDCGDWKILSFSPELFLKREGDRILTEPIKGTVARGATEQEDTEAEQWLRTSEKNLAELLMIVDLERNDLGRICRSGSVKWGPFPHLLTLPNVHHLSCLVSGILKDKVSILDIVKATFPGGSISGAPKRRALQILRELEHCRRGPYCGAIGFASADRLLFNLGIRTGVWKEGAFRFWGGGGIVDGHDPSQEQEEIRSKLSPITQALGVPVSEFWNSNLA